MPTKAELDHYIARSDGMRRPDKDSGIAWLHRVSLRGNAPRRIFVLAFDQRREMEEIAAACEAKEADIRKFKSIVCTAVEQVRQAGNGDAELGIVVDERYGDAVLSRMTNDGWWIGRPVEIPGSRPVQFEPRNNMGVPLVSWPASHLVKCLVRYRPDDPIELRLEQERLVCQLHADCVDLGREMLLAIACAPGDPAGNASAVANAVRRFYNLGVFPAWWQLEPQSADAWREIGNVIGERDPYCNGALVSDVPGSDSVEGFRAAAHMPVCKGFVAGLSSIEGVAHRWFGGELGDGEAADIIAGNFQRSIENWRNAVRPTSGELRASGSPVRE